MFVRLDVRNPQYYSLRPWATSSVEVLQPLEIGFYFSLKFKLILPWKFCKKQFLQLKIVFHKRIFSFGELWPQKSDSSSCCRERFPHFCGFFWCCLILVWKFALNKIAGWNTWTSISGDFNQIPKKSIFARQEFVIVVETEFLTGLIWKLFAARLLYFSAKNQFRNNSVIFKAIFLSIISGFAVNRWFLSHSLIIISRVWPLCAQTGANIGFPTVGAPFFSAFMFKFCTKGK